MTTKVAKREYDDWSPYLKESCERYMAMKEEQDRKYLAEFRVKTNIAENHTLTPNPFPNPNEGKFVPCLFLFTFNSIKISSPFVFLFDLNLKEIRILKIKN